MSSKETTFTKMLEMQQQIFQKCLQSFMECKITRIENVLIDTTKTIADLKQSLLYTQNEVAKSHSCQRVRDSRGRTAWGDTQSHQELESNQSSVTQAARTGGDFIPALIENELRRGVCLIVNSYSCACATGSTEGDWEIGSMLYLLHN